MILHVEKVYKWNIYFKWFINSINSQIYCAGGGGSSETGNRLDNLVTDFTTSGNVVLMVLLLPHMDAMVTILLLIATDNGLSYGCGGGGGSSNIQSSVTMTPFALAMPDIYKTDDAIESYRAYYRTKPASWKNREKPYWF